jgi:epoxyqueuosine reductase
VGFRALFAGSPIKRIGVGRFLRNCLIAAGNSGEVGLLKQVRTLQEHVDPVVAEAAEWAESQLLEAVSGG